MPGGHKFQGKNPWQAAFLLTKAGLAPPHQPPPPLGSLCWGFPAHPGAPPREARTVEWEFLAPGHRQLRPNSPLQPRRRAGPSRWPRTPRWSPGPAGGTVPGAPCRGRPVTALRGQLHGQELVSLFGAGGDRAERWRPDGGKAAGAVRRGPEGMRARGGAGGVTRNSAAGHRRRDSGTQGEWPRRADVGKQGPGSAALTHPRSPPGAHH